MNPQLYPGLTPFSEEEARFFFGREEQERKIARSLYVSRLTVLLGESGVGKSSILEAGVLPIVHRNAKQRREAGKPHLVVVVFRDWHQQNPLKELLEKIRDSVAEAMNMNPTHLQMEPTPTESLQVWTKKLGGGQGFGQLFLILDQFEEYFQYHAREAGAGTFADEFPRWVNRSDLLVNFLIAMRQDALAKLDRFHERILNILDDRLELKHLDRVSAKNAIVKPIGEYNLQQIVADYFQTSRLTVLSAGNGTGKSRVLQEIARVFRERTGNLSEVITFKSWQNNPVTDLVQQIETDLKERFPNILAPEPRASLTETLQGWAERLARDEQNVHLFIILDQFEEFFQYQQPSMKEDSFVAELARAVNHSELPVHFLISIRDEARDLLKHFEAYIPSIFDHLLQMKQLGENPTIADLVKPIEEPTHQPSKAIDIDPELVEAVLDQLGPLSIKDLEGTQDETSDSSTSGNSGNEEFEAPLLQLVMQYIWAEKIKCDLKFLCLQTLNNLGGVKKIVNEHLNQAMGKLGEKQKDIIFKVFNYLVTPSKTKCVHSAADLAGRIHCDSTEMIDLLNLLAGEGYRILKTVDPLPNQPIKERFEIRHDVLAQPILDWQKRHLDQRQREQDQQDIEQERHQHEQKINKEIMNRTHTIKKELTAQSLQQKLLQQHEVAALLARQAYHFNQQDKLQVLDRVDDALRKVLSASHFSNILKAHTSAFSSIAFSPDGTKLAAASLDGKIWLWNWNRSQHGSKPKTLDNQHENSACEKEVYSLAFSPDGHWLASANLGNTTIRLWDLHHEDAVCTVIGNHDQGVRCIAFSPDGNLLASGSEDKTVKLWQHWHQPDQFPIVLKEHSLKGEMGSVCSLAFSPDTSPDGSQLAVGCFDRSIWLWDVQEPAQTPDKEPTVRYGHEEQVNALAFSPDGQTLASASDDRTIRLWDMSQYRAVPEVLTAHTEKIRTLAFSPDGKMLASASDDQTIRLWDAHEFEKAPQVIRGHTFDIFSVAFSPDSQFLASASADNTVRLWDLNPPIAQPRILKGHQEKVRSIAISSQDGPDQLLASGSEDGTVRLWKLSQLDTEPKITELEIFKRCGKVFGVALFVSADRQTQLLAAGSADNNIRLWDLRKPSDVWLRELKGHRDGVSSVAFSPDGKWLASGSWKIDGTVKLWNLNQLEPEPISFKGKGHTDGITSVAFSPDGKTLASAGNDRKICLWNVERPDTDPIVLQNHNGRVWSIAFSPDGKLLASASDDWELQVWNLENLDPKYPVHVRLKGHSAWVSSVAFSPDGKTLASGSFDRSIRLWRINQIDWKSGKIKINVLPIVLENHNQSITSVAFTPDGKYLASGSYDNTVRLWLVSTDRLAEMVCQKVWRNLTMDEWQKFMGDDIPYESTCPNLPPREGAPTTL